MSIRVLIIDDSATIRAMLEQVVSDDPDCKVVGVAPDVATAHRLMRNAWPDVVTLDLTMPGGDGLHFLRTMKTDPHVPVVVVSGAAKAGSREVDEALALGADVCFDKAKLLTQTARFLRVLKKTARSRRLGGLHDHRESA